MQHRFQERARSLSNTQLMAAIKCMEAVYDPGSTVVAVDLPMKLTHYYTVAEERRLISSVSE